MAAIMRIVSSVGGGTVLDLNAAPGGGVMNARGEKILANIALTDQQVDQQAMWWAPTTSPSEAATRQISVPLLIQGTSQDDVAARIKALNQAVSVPFVLEVRRHGASTSGWLRCYPTVVQPSASINAAGTRLFAEVTLSARTEPYAYGAMVDTGNLTFRQDVTGVTPFYQDISGVDGDALAPCLIRWDLSPVTAFSTHASRWAIRRHGTVANLNGAVAVRGVSETTSFASSGNVTFSATVTDTPMSGNSARRITFAAGATTSDYATLTYQFSSLTGVDANGTYRLVARVRRGGGGAGDEHTLRPTYGAYTPQDYSWPATGADLRVLDLGLIDIPVGQATQLAAPLSARGASVVSVTLRVMRSIAGASTFDIDWLALIPADEDHGLWRLQQASAVWAYADGFSGDSGFANADLATSTSALLVGSDAGSATAWLGGMPRLAPGVTNRLYVVQGFTSAMEWPKTSAPVVKVAYWPRYRWVP